MSQFQLIIHFSWIRVMIFPSRLTDLQPWLLILMLN